MINKIVELQDGRKGKVIGQLKNREFMLESGKGGQISFFKQTDITNVN